MIVEPPDGTKLVLADRGYEDSDIVVYRDDKNQADRYKTWRSIPDAHWHWDLGDNHWTCSSWEEIQGMGTLYLIGPKLEEQR